MFRKVFYQSRCDNVIDHWFFENGIENITNRRTTIVQFLSYLQTKDLSPNSKMYLKFGKGGVKKTAIFRSELFGLRGRVEVSFPIII